MDKRIKVHFVTKLLSMHHYLSEVPVDGKTTGKYFKRLGYNEHYVSLIIRTGNCITLLSTVIPISVDNFWNTNYLEDITRFVFWTFNKSFVLKLTEKIESLKLSDVQRCAELLKENFIPYGEPMPDNIDEEVQFCYVKNGNLKKDPKFSQMYLVDQGNRTAILKAIEKRMAELQNSLRQPITPEELPIKENITQTSSNKVSFLDILRPYNGSPEETLQFIRQRMEDAGFEFNLFSPVLRLDNGKNPYGLNGCMAAMIDHFYQLNYFKNEYTLEQIFKAYLQYSGNTIGKLKTFLSEFRNDKSFIKHSDKLKRLKVDKML